MSAQISLSFELISLLNWLVRHEKAMLNSIIRHALERGFAEELEKIDTTQTVANHEDLYNTVLDFLEYLEHALIKNMDSIHIDTSTKDAIMPTLHKLEADSLDQKTLWLSMQQTRARILKAQQEKKSSAPAHETPQQTPHSQHASEILFQQLLKNWKPNNKETMN